MSMETPSWIQELFSSIDAMDVDTFASFLTEDAQFKFGNAPPATGKEAIKKAVGGFFSTLHGLKHALLNTWSHSGSIIVQGEVTYTRKDASTVTLPFVNVFGMQGNLIEDYLIYMDINPLFQQK